MDTAAPERAGISKSQIEDIKERINIEDEIQIIGKKAKRCIEEDEILLWGLIE